MNIYENGMIAEHSVKITKCFVAFHVKQEDKDDISYHNSVFPKISDDLYIISSNLVHLGNTFVLQY